MYDGFYETETDISQTKLSEAPIFSSSEKVLHKFEKVERHD
jgi:hypothetical protein